MKKESEIDTALIKVIRLLRKEGISYLLIGGIASSILGEARMTQDIDILIYMENENIDKFLLAASKNGFTFDKNKINRTIESMGVFKFFLNHIHLDFIIGKMPFEIEALTRKKEIKILGQVISIPTPEDLIVFKLISGRDKDIVDIEGIVTKNQDKLDIEYTKKWAKIIARDIGSLKPVKILESVLNKIRK